MELVVDDKKIQGGCHLMGEKNRISSKMFHYRCLWNIPLHGSMVGMELNGDTFKMPSFPTLRMPCEHEWESSDTGIGNKCKKKKKKRKQMSTHYQNSIFSTFNNWATVVLNQSNLFVNGLISAKCRQILLFVFFH